MHKALISSSKQLYAFLLRFYPKNYQQEFGDEMKYVFSESLKDAYETKKEQGLIYLWSRTVIDAIKSLGSQHIDNLKGGELMKNKKIDIIQQDKAFLLLAVGTLAALTIPLLARFPWTTFDFLVMGALIFSMGSIFIFAARKFKKNRLLVSLVVGGLFFWLWVELAVGLFTNWGS